MADMEQKADKAPIDPNFPRMLFHADTKLTENGPTQHRTVNSKEEMDAALADGWLKAPPQVTAAKASAAKAEKNK